MRPETLATTTYLATMLTAAVPAGAWAADATDAGSESSPGTSVLAGGLTLQNSLGSEYLESYGRQLVLDAAKAKLELRARPLSGLRLGLSVLGTEYLGTTAIPMDGYLPPDARSTLVGADPAAARPSTADLLHVQLVRELRLHEAYVEAGDARFRLRLGRQLFLAGTGSAFRPTDLFNPSRPSDPAWEPDGHDGARLTIDLGHATVVEGFLERDPLLRKANGIARVSSVYQGWRAGLSFTRHWQARTDWQALNTVDGLTAGPAAFVRQFRWDLLAGELSGAAAGMNLRAEAGYAIVRAPAEVGTLGRAGEDHLRLLLGMDRAFRSGLDVSLEYMYLGQGAVRARALDLDDRLALLTGEVPSASRNTLFFLLAQRLAARFTLGVRGTLLAMDAVNVVPSPFLGWRISERAALDLSATVPIGPRRGVIGNSGPGAVLWLKVETGIR